MICICGNAKEDDKEMCEVCGFVYELHPPEAQIDLDAETPESLYVEIIVE